MPHQIRRYTFKLYPNQAQEAALCDQAQWLAWVWNAALEQRETQWRLECQRRGRENKRKKITYADGGRKGLGYYDQAREIKVLRGQFPELAAMSCASFALCLKALDLSFKEFWRKLKEGKPYKEAGYPKYKSAARHKTIWHRDGSGWRLDAFGNNWKFYFKGVPGLIKARGKFPIKPDEIRTMEIIHRDGSWQASVVVYQQPRMQAGKNNLTVDFNLLDKFATVKSAKGWCAPRLQPEFFFRQEQITDQIQHHNATSGAEAVECGGDRKKLLDRFGLQVGAEAVECGGDHKGEYISRNHRLATEHLTDSIQSNCDKRYKRFSWRWKREKKHIAARRSKAARVNKDALHNWTSALVKNATSITIICPPIKQHTKSAKGNQRDWGAAVETVASLNRNTLSQAPRMAIDMLKYKCEEAGVNFCEIAPETTDLRIGTELPKAQKAVRKTRRKLKEAA